MDYIDKFQHLNINKSHGEESPHKPAMLLAVMDILESALKPTNRIEFGGDLRERFRGYFKLVATERDHPHAHYPFFHLRSEPFWHHVAIEGREALLEAFSTARKASQVTENIEYAKLDDDLFGMACDPAGRVQLREALIIRYFPARADAVRERISSEGQVASLQRRFAGQSETADPDDLGGASQVAEQPPLDLGNEQTEARKAAFRRLVVPAYDYVCAACGLRVITDDSWLAQACHLIPWSISHDDDPRNGISLCPNHHWAMDRDLIAPGPDMVWHVSGELDKRRDGDRNLVDLSKRSVLGPTGANTRFAPKAEALEWRVKRLA